MVIEDGYKGDSNKKIHQQNELQKLPDKSSWIPTLKCSALLQIDI